MITRVYDELANTYYEMNDVENAEKLFREVIHRYISLSKFEENLWAFFGKNEYFWEFGE